MKLTALLTTLILALTLTACTITPEELVGYAPKADNKALSDTQNETLLTREEAITAALTQAGFEKSEVWDLEAELDRERGVTVWEVDFDAGRTEYSYVLDAQTGNILHQGTEWD